MHWQMTNGDPFSACFSNVLKRRLVAAPLRRPMGSPCDRTSAPVTNHLVLTGGWEIPETTPLENLLPAPIQKLGAEFLLFCFFQGNLAETLTGVSIYWTPPQKRSINRGKFSRARNPWSANCELKHWNFGGEKCLIHGLHFTVYPLPNSRFVRLFCLQFTVYAPFSGCSWHTSRQPLLRHPLSSQFALHGLHAFKVG